MALIIPKNNADPQTLDATLQIYYDAGDWVDNATLIDKLSRKLIDLGVEDEQKEPQSYTKKTQVLAYYGFITWEDLSDKQSRRKITDLGRRFYEARSREDQDAVIDVLMDSLKTQTFGRNVIGCDSDSDVEAPNVFIKASALLDGLSNKEFAYILQKMELEHIDFSSAIFQVKLQRLKGVPINPSNAAAKWADPKPITALKNWGFLDNDNNNRISQSVLSRHSDELMSLKTYNTEESNASFYQNSYNITDHVMNSSYKSYLAAIRTKPFVLLAGISGTGKSRIVREFAFKSCPKYLQDKDETTPGNYCMIEVKPNWHDSTELLGYYSNLSGSYQFKKFVKFLVKAMMFPDVPFFVCLDEMNLAPVEQYFAEILSILETRKHPKNIETGVVDMNTIKTDPIIESKFFKEYTWKDGDGALHTNVNMTDKDWYEAFIDTDSMTEDEKEQVSKYQYSRILQKDGLKLPDNVIIIGTVNMDDTTHQFSRKVIDRAMTIEMNGGRLADLYGGSKNLEYLNEDEQQKWQHNFTQRYVTADEVLEAHSEFAEEIKNKLPYRLEKINEALKGTPFEVSYRVLNELTIMVGVMLDDNDKNESLDSIINQAINNILLMKILPRIEGDAEMFALSKKYKIEMGISYNDRLEWLKDLAPDIAPITETASDENASEDDTEGEDEGGTDNESQESTIHQQTAKDKIKEMIDRLNNQDFTRFWP